MHHADPSWELAVIIFSVCGYLTMILRMHTSKKPQSLASWLSFLVINSAIVLGCYLGGKPMTQVLTFETGITAIIGFTLFVFKGTMELSAAGITALVTAIIGSGLYLIVNDDVAIMVSVVAMFIAGYPLYLALWKDPQSQPRLSWTFFALGSVCELLAHDSFRHWTYTDAFMPSIFIFQQTSIIALTFRKHVWAFLSQLAYA